MQPILAESVPRSRTWFVLGPMFAAGALCAALFAGHAQPRHHRGHLPHMAGCTR